MTMNKQSLLTLFCLLLPILSEAQSQRNIRGSPTSSARHTRSYATTKTTLPASDDRLLKSSSKSCQAVPLRTKTNGDITNFGRVYASVTAEVSTQFVNPTLLCNDFVDAYNNVTDCSAAPGSFRDMLSCTPLTGSGPANSFAFLLDYGANVVDGGMIFTYTPGPTPTCNCECKDGILPGVGSMLDDGSVSCTCFCDPKNVDCACNAPFAGTFLSQLNSLSSLYNFTDARQLILLDVDTCNTTQTEYDFQAICPGSEAVAFEFLSTDFPSQVPSEMPSEMPSEEPTEFPTEIPTLSSAPTITASPSSFKGGGKERRW